MGPEADITRDTHGRCPHLNKSIYILLQKSTFEGSCNLLICEFEMIFSTLNVEIIKNWLQKRMGDQELNGSLVVSNKRCF